LAIQPSSPAEHEVEQKLGAVFKVRLMVDAPN
jgi:hypothetical protein